jgi:hypothetical protein
MYEMGTQQKNILVAMQKSGDQHLPRMVTFGCLTLVDATGNEHQILLDFCTSFQVRLASGLEKFTYL